MKPDPCSKRSPSPSSSALARPRLGHWSSLGLARPRLGHWPSLGSAADQAQAQHAESYLSNSSFSHSQSIGTLLGEFISALRPRPLVEPGFDRRPGHARQLGICWFHGSNYFTFTSNKDSSFLITERPPSLSAFPSFIQAAF